MAVVASRDSVTFKPDSFSAVGVLPRLYLLVMAPRGVDGMAVVAPLDRITRKPGSFLVTGICRASTCRLWRCAVPTARQPSRRATPSRSNSSFLGS